MRNKIGNLLWGLCFLAVGVLLIARELGFLDYDLFFKGWWTLFIIVPSVISIVQHGVNVGNGIAFTVGALLFLSANRYITAGLIFPAILVVIGLGILFRRPTIKGFKMPAGQFPDITAIFSGQEIRPKGEKFEGATITAIMGGVDLDLREAVIEKDAAVRVTAIMGGVDIFVPNTVKVVVGGTQILGGCTNNARDSLIPDAPTVYIEANCIMGGLEVK